MTPAPDAETPQPQPQPVRHAPLWLLALITLSGTLAMHIFVPALPVAAEALHASAAAAQLTLSAYIIGLAIGQVTYGPISDQIGRRPVLVAGMILYAVASLAAMLAPTIELLTVSRFLQAMGGCSGLVLGRAIIRDTAAGDEAVRKLSLMNLMVMAGPGFSPLLGSLLAETTGWRSIFAATCLLGLVNLLLIWRLLPERRQPGGQVPASLLHSYGNLLRSRSFLLLAFGGGCATTSMYAFIGGAPFIFASLDRPAHEVGFYLALNIVGVWFGSLAANRLIGRVPMRRLMVLGNLFSCLCALVFLLFVLSGTLNVMSTLIPMMLLSCGAGITSPMALAAALSINPSITGSASGLYGFAQMSIGAACTALGSIGGNPALAVAIVLLSAGILAQLSFRFAQPRAR